jgi:glycosyltransferase involved in cell wall biosynthesis
LYRKITGTKNLRLIATCHVVGVGTSRTPRIINQRLSYFFDVFALMAQDTQWRNFISANKKSNIHVIVNGITANVIKGKLKESNKKHLWTVGTISRLQTERKPWLFLEVFAELHESMKGQVRFVLGGEGPERVNLVGLSQKFNLGGSLSMPGLIQDPKIFLDHLDLYVALNVEEVTGIAGLEAVFSGVPTVSIQLSPNYKKGANDWIWSDQNPQSVAREIASLLENPKKLAEVAKNQHRVAIRDYSVERMRDDYLRFYSSNG